jgi:hypothetical protein
VHRMFSSTNLPTQPTPHDFLTALQTELASSTDVFSLSQPAYKIVSLGSNKFDNSATSKSIYLLVNR